MKHLMEGIVCCDRGTCLIPSEQARRLNKERYDVLTIPSLLLKSEQTGELDTVDQKIREHTM